MKMMIAAIKDMYYVSTKNYDLNLVYILSIPINFMFIYCMIKAHFYEIGENILIVMNLFIHIQNSSY